MGTKKTYLLSFVSLCIISKINIPVCRRLQFCLIPVSYLVVSQYWYDFHLCHKYHKPQKKMAIQSQNCTSSLSYSGNQTLLVNNRDVTKESASIKNSGLFPHSCVVPILIFRTVEVSSLASNCAGNSFPKGILNQLTTGDFASLFLFQW